MSSMCGVKHRQSRAQQGRQDQGQGIWASGQGRRQDRGWAGGSGCERVTVGPGGRGRAIWQGGLEQLGGKQERGGAKLCKRL